MSDEEDYPWLFDIAKSFGHERIGQLDHLAGWLMVGTAPGKELNAEITQFCNSTSTTHHYTPGDIHEIISLMAMGIDRVSQKYGETAENYAFPDKVGDPPRAYATTYYNRDHDTIVITQPMVRLLVENLKNRRQGVDGNVINTAYPDMPLTNEEAIVLDMFDLALGAHQLKQPENLHLRGDDPSLKAARHQAGREFIAEMRREQYIGKFIAGSGHVFKDVDMGRQQIENRQQG